VVAYARSEPGAVEPAALIAGQLAIKYGVGNVFKHPARQVYLWTRVVNLFDAFYAYERADSKIEWCSKHPDLSEWIDEIKASLDDDDQRYL